MSLTNAHLFRLWYCRARIFGLLSIHSSLTQHLWMLPVVKYLFSVWYGDLQWYISSDSTVVNAIGIKRLIQRMLLGSSSRLVGLGTQLATLARSPSHQDTQVITTFAYNLPGVHEFRLPKRAHFVNKTFLIKCRWCAATDLVVSPPCFLVSPSPAWPQCPGTL